MTNHQLTAYLQDESYLYKLSYEELKTLVVQYPYAANLRILLLKKAHLEQNKDYDRHLQMAAAYSTDRRFLYKLVKKLKTLQAIPENVILADDYLELTELSNIEKILSTRQPAEALANAENDRTLSADFNLQFEKPSHSPDDDDALFELNAPSSNKLDFNFMTDEEVDFLVDDIVSKFQNPAENVSLVDKNEAVLLEKEPIITQDIQTVFHTNGHEKQENTEGVEDTLDFSKNPIHTSEMPPISSFLNGIDHSEAAIHTKEDKVIDEEILKLDVFKLPNTNTGENSETVEHKEYLDNLHPLENPEIVSFSEPMEDFKPMETKEGDYVVNEQVSSEMQNLYYTSSLPWLEDDTADILPEAPTAHVPSVPTVSFVEDVVEPPEAKIINESVETQEPKKASSQILSDDTSIYKSIEDFLTTKQSNIVVTKRTIVKSVEDFKVLSKDELSNLHGKRIPNPDVVEDFTKIGIPEAALSTETTLENIIDNSQEAQAGEKDISIALSPNSVIEDFMDETAKTTPIDPEFLMIEPIENQAVINTNATAIHQEDKSVSMGYFENEDVLIKKKDNHKPVIELEIINQSKATLVESIALPPSVADVSTSFSEWLQQFQKPKLSDIVLTETVKDEPKKSRQDTDNQVLTQKNNKQRKYELDNLAGLFESEKDLPDNLFFGLSATDATSNIVEKWQEPEPVAEDVHAILEGFLNETNAVSHDKDLEWLSIPIENAIVVNNSENAQYLENEATEQVEKEPTDLAEAPQKKKKKKMMHELAARSLQTDYDIISEPLADIYAAQGLNDKAIEMYERLSLHIPEKSDFFAAKIEKLRNTRIA
jgi:hypothetical protein